MQLYRRLLSLQAAPAATRGITRVWQPLPSPHISQFPKPYTLNPHHLNPNPQTLNPQPLQA